MTLQATRGGVESRPEFADILAKDVAFASPHQPSMARRVNAAFDRLMLEAGLETRAGAWLMLSVFCAVTLGGIGLLLTDTPIAAATFAAAGMLIPIVIATRLRESRRGQLYEQLPDAIDRLARLSRAGRNLENALIHVARDAEQPLKTELIRLADEIRLGTDVPRSLRTFARRTGLPATHVLATVLTVNSQSGGDLPEPLFKLADTIRDELLQRHRERATVLESQWPGGALILLPLVMGSLYLANQPGALDVVLSSFVGRMALSLAGALWCLGTIVALRTIRPVSK